MTVLTRIKNKELSQRAKSGETASAHDCYEADEDFSAALDGSWRTKVDDTSLWVRNPQTTILHPPRPRSLSRQ